MRRTSTSISLIALATALRVAIPAAPAFAQATGDTDAPAADAAAPVADASEGVADIVVTAQRRSENLQDIPLSVATINDETLAAINSGGADIRGLSGRVPSLNIESSFGRTFPRFYIRGLGNTDFDLNASQPVSLVYDDVVLENPILKGFPAFDVDRVEVLRGPQGTLFGRNTPAGIVKFDTVKPGKGRNYARISYGTYSHDQCRGRGRRPAQRHSRGSRVGPVAAPQRLDRQSRRVRRATTSKAMTTSPCAPRSSSSRPTR